MDENSVDNTTPREDPQEVGNSAGETGAAGQSEKESGRREDGTWFGSGPQNAQGNPNGYGGYGPQDGPNGYGGYGPQGNSNGYGGYGPQGNSNGYGGYGPQGNPNGYGPGYGPQGNPNGYGGYGPQGNPNGYGGYGPGYGPGPNPYGGVPTGPHGKRVGIGMAVASMACGITAAALFLTVINIPLAIIAIVLGIVYLVNYEPVDRGFAIAGIVTGVLSFVLMIVSVLVIANSPLIRSFQSQPPDRDEIIQEYNDAIEDYYDQYFSNDSYYH